MTGRTSCFIPPQTLAPLTRPLTSPPPTRHMAGAQPMGRLTASRGSAWILAARRLRARCKRRPQSLRRSGGLFPGQMAPRGSVSPHRCSALRCRQARRPRHFRQGPVRACRGRLRRRARRLHRHLVFCCVGRNVRALIPSRKARHGAMMANVTTVGQAVSMRYASWAMTAATVVHARRQSPRRHPRRHRNNPPA